LLEKPAGDEYVFITCALADVRWGKSDKKPKTQN
jgi:hypothetical protein